MKKIIILLVVLGLGFSWNNLTAYFADPLPDYSKEHGGAVMFYSAEWCGYCKKTRGILVDNKIPFYEYDVEKSAEGLKQFRSLGGSSVPLLQINGNVIRGYQPEKIMALVQSPGLD